MAVVPLYKQPGPKAQMLDALRRGMTRAAAAEAGGAKLQTFMGWVERDALWQLEVEAAEKEARATGADRTAKAARDPKTGGDKWKTLRDEAAKLAPGMFGILLYVDGILASKGHPPMSPWWRETLRAFYESGKRWCILLVGRGGGKSTTLERCALVEAIFAERDVPPGQTWIWPFLSVKKSDARRRLDEIGSLLDALGIEYARATIEGDPTITFADAAGNNVALVSIAATIAGVSGPSAIGVTCDEEEKWKDLDTGANPATEVLRSIRQMFRTRPNIRGYRCSSKWTDNNAHFQAAQDGDTPAHFVARLGADGLARAREGLEMAARLEDEIGNPDGADAIRKHAATLTERDARIPTFVANPAHDIAVGRTEEPDIDTWLREVCSAGEGGIEGDVFDSAAITKALHVPLAPGRGGRFAAIDTGAKKNPAALAIVERVVHQGGYQWRPILLRTWRRERGAPPLDLRLVVLPEMARLTKEHGCMAAWWSDGWAGDAVELVAAEHGIAVHYVSTSTAYRDLCEPFERALLLSTGPAVALSGCDGAEVAAAQLRTVRKGQGQTVIWPEVGSDHVEHAQVLLRAMAHAEIATLAGAVVTRPPVMILGDGRYSAARRSFAGRRM
jgi:hypothetical protein